MSTTDIYLSKNISITMRYTRLTLYIILTNWNLNKFVKKNIFDYLFSPNSFVFVWFLLLLFFTNLNNSMNYLNTFRPTLLCSCRGISIINTNTVPSITLVLP